MTEATELSTIQRLLGARSPAERLPEAVEALATAIERGHHIALVAGEGARLCRLYAAAAIRDLGDAEEARALLLASTSDRARRLARSIERLGSELGWETVLWTAERAGSGAPISDRALIVATPARLLADVRAGRVSLGEPGLIVIDDARGMGEAWPAVEAILQAAGGDARRIAATHERDEEFDKLIERQLFRARRWPPELFADQDTTARRAGPPIRIGAAESHDVRLERLVGLLHGLALEDPEIDRVAVWCDGPATAASIEAALAIEGFAMASDPDDAGFRVAPFESAAGTGGGGAGPAVAFGLPWTAAELEATLGPARFRAAIVPPRHIAQMEILAARMGWPVRPLPDPVEVLGDDIAAFRGRIEQAIEDRDLATAALLIDPLVEEHGYARVASALASLLRSFEIAGGTPAPSAPAGAGPAEDAARATRPAWTRVFVNVGRQDGVSPGDFVGAITGETSASAAQVGKIEIRQRFSLVDIDSMIVDEVIRGLTGAKIRNRDVLARRDRGT